ncbi:MAG: molybdopterin-guanine dinucleotide biosynthesis protein B [Candidatus Thorarchaeota archaeon]|jgi:molybdopterin-guanine dinucleotide biosynthesis protein B
MRIFLISGYSSTGKTTLIERLVGVLTSGGHRVATIKSSNEDILLDSEKDTVKHARAGADPVIFLGPNSTLLQHGQRLSLDALSRQLDVEFILVEGMKSSELPKFWCIGNNKLGDLPRNTRAVIQWTDGVTIEGSPIPVVSSEDVNLLAAIIERDAVLVSDVVESGRKMH